MHSPSAFLTASVPPLIAHRRHFMNKQVALTADALFQGRQPRNNIHQAAVHWTQDRVLCVLGSESPSGAAHLLSLTYELVQEDEWGDVAGQAQQLADYHEPVPRLYGQRHHQQLGQDERGEGNGDDVDELWIEEQQRPVHDDAACGVKREGAAGEWDQLLARMIYTKSTQLLLLGLCLLMWLSHQLESLFLPW